MQGYSNALYYQTSCLNPSNDVIFSPWSAPNLNADAHAPAPVHSSVPGQIPYLGGPAGNTTQCDPHDLIRLVQGFPVPAPFIRDNGPLVRDFVTGYDLISPFIGFVPKEFTTPCICSNRHWLAWCARVAEHYNYAILYSSRAIHLPCCCEWALPKTQIPKWCPKAAIHLLDWVSHDLPMYARDIG